MLPFRNLISFEYEIPNKTTHGKLSEHNSNVTKMQKPEGTAANPDKAEIPTKVRRAPEERERRVRVHLRVKCVAL